MTPKCQRLTTLSPQVSFSLRVMTTGFQSRNTASPRVLVLDDDPISRLVLAELTRSLGVDASEADDPVQAIELCLAGQADALLVDLSMPEMDGFEVLRRLRDAERTQQRAAVPVVAVTGHVGAEHRARTHAAGFAHHLDKPVERPALAAVLEALFAAPPAAPSGGTASAWTDAHADAALMALIAGQLPDSQFLNTLARTFESRTRELIAKLGAADPTNAADLMSRLRGCAQGIGADDLANRCHLDKLSTLPDIANEFDCIAQSLMRAAARLSALPPDPPA